MKIVLCFICTFVSMVYADISRQIAIVKDVETALKDNQPFEKIINFRFFGSYAEMDGFFDRIHRKLCISGNSDVDLFLAELVQYPQSKQTLTVLASVRDKLHGLPLELQHALKTNWSYQKLLTYVGKLDCIIQETDQLYRNSDFLLKQNAKKLYTILNGYDVAENRLKEIKKHDQAFARKTKSKWAAVQKHSDSRRHNSNRSNRDGVSGFEIMHISLGMSYPEIVVFQPGVRLIADARGTASVPQLELKLEQQLRTGNNIEVKIYLGIPGSEVVVRDIRYSLDLAGLNPRACRKVIDKLFAKYGRPDMDFTGEIVRNFHYRKFTIQLKSQYDKVLSYCWGDCQLKDMGASKTDLTPGTRLMMNFDKERKRLELRLYEDAIDEFNPATLFVEEEENSLEF